MEWYWYLAPTAGVALGAYIAIWASNFYRMKRSRRR